MNKEPFLPEDKDLVDRLGKISRPETPFQTSDVELAALQIEALLRTRKSYEDNGRVQDRFSWVLLAVAVLQIMLALLQLTYDIFPADDLPGKIGVFVISILGIVGAFYWMVRDIRN